MASRRPRRSTPPCGSPPIGRRVRWRGASASGCPRVVHSLDALHATVPDGRYRVMPLLRVARGERRIVLPTLELTRAALRRYRAVIFDMDGLLLDTEVLWQRAEAGLFARHGATFTLEDKMRVIGTNFAFTARYFARAPRLAAERRAELVQESDRPDARPGARPGRCAARAPSSWSTACGHAMMPLGLASNSPALPGRRRARQRRPRRCLRRGRHLRRRRARQAGAGHLPAGLRTPRRRSGGGGGARGLGVGGRRRQGRGAGLHRGAAVRRDRCLRRGSRHRLARGAARRVGCRGNAYPLGMCRSIKTLRTVDEPATDDEIRAAALQYVRKVSGYRKPSTGQRARLRRTRSRRSRAPRAGCSRPWPRPTPARRRH